MGYRYDPQRDWPPDYSWRNKKQAETEPRSPMVGVACVVLIALLLMAMVFSFGCSEKVEIEPVRWSESERCQIIWGKDC